MWFKYGLKAQKLLAQGIALGIIAICKTPCKGNKFVPCGFITETAPSRLSNADGVISRMATFCLLVIF